MWWAVHVAQRLAYLLPDLAAPGLIPSVLEFFSEEKNIDVAQVNQQRWS